MTKNTTNWTFPQIAANAITQLTTPQMIEVDRLMIDQYGIILIQMMENAGRGLAITARDYFDAIAGKGVAVLAGSGGNGGGALVAARRLAGWGADVRVYLGQGDDEMTPIPAHQLNAVRQMGLDVTVGVPSADAQFDIILDGVIGYSLSGAPTGLRGDLIAWANAQDVPIIALDAPSGVDASSGTVYDPAINATATVTLALPKTGLFNPATLDHIGRLFLADLSVPTGLYAEPSLGLGLQSPFAHSDIVEIV